jgi:TRAP transporter TAXI family solute receptor
VRSLPFVLAALWLGALPAASAPIGAEPVNLLAGRGSSIYYALGVALADAIDRAIPGNKTAVRGTRGSIDNLNLLHEGTGEIALASGDALASAWSGDTSIGFKAPLAKLRGIAALYPDAIQIVARADSGIRTLDDLRGKRVSVGAAQSAIELDARTILAAAGLSYASLGEVKYFPFGESAEEMKAGHIDATLQSSVPGALGLRDLANAVDVVFVPIPPEVVRKIGNGVYAPATIPAGTYRGQEASVPVVAVPNYLVTRDDVPAELVYRMTRALWSARDQLAAAVPEAGAIELKRALEGMPVPLHPGAERYYRESGLIRGEKRSGGEKRPGGDKPSTVNRRPG